MDMPPSSQDHSSAILESKKQKYKRNYIALLFDSFFFSFAGSIFSYTTVLPVYVAGLTNNTIFISLLAVLYFGLSNGASVFSCILGTNTKSPKWTAVLICLTQRLGFLMMVISTYSATGNRSFALAIFFLSFGIYGIAAGMSSPVHSVLVSSTIYRNLSSFYGTYNLVGAFSGVLSAQIVRLFFEKYDFPFSYRRIFLLGFLVAMLSTLSLAAGISETKAEKKKQFSFPMLSGTVREILKNNKEYRNFLLVRIFAAMAEMSIPFYIIYIGSIENAGERIVGNMTTVLFISYMAASKIAGFIGDRFGPATMIRFAVLSGFLASLLVIFIPSTSWGYLIFILLGMATTVNLLSNNVANIHFARDGLVSIYTMTSGIIIAPFYAVFSFLGGIISNRQSIIRVFIISAVLYAFSFILSIFLNRKKLT